MKPALLFLVACVALAQWTAPTLAQPKSSTAKLLQRAGSIAKKVSKIRGLPIKHRIKRGVMTKAQIRKRLLKRLGEEYSPKQLAAEELAMKRLGLLPEKMNYKDTVIKMFTNNIAGFYDPADKKLYIAGWSTKGLAMQADAVMAHEIDHALQDQTFNLDKFMKGVKANGDATVARQALVEGDGMVLMIEYAMNGMNPWTNPAMMKMMMPQLRSGMRAQMSTMKNTPLVLREGMIFPYMAGMQFVVHFRRHNKWKRIDRIYRKPPLSTEHILHPKKYVNYERPDTITPRRISTLKGYEKVHKNITGELGLAIFLRQHGVPTAKANAAAAGWGGDTTVLYAPRGHRGTVAGSIGIIATVWDNDKQAIEFMEALTHAMPKLSKGRKLNSDTKLVHYVRGNQAFVAKRIGDRVNIVLGAAPHRAAQLVGQISRRWRVRRR